LKGEDMQAAREDLNQILVMQNTVMDYAWGSRTAIPELLGKKSPSPKPQAELWMGAHPKAPSRVRLNGRWIPLSQLIDEYPLETLGSVAAQRFKGRLPFLLKVLAAAKPLSIQAHPSKSQAQKGFADENRRKVPMDAPRRNYRDDNHKPECICALTPFWAMCGFRTIDRIQSLLKQACPYGLRSELELLGDPSAGKALKKLFKVLITMETTRRKAVIAEAVDTAGRHPKEAVFQWLPKLALAYPGDIGALAPLFLNLVCLAPGQALFLGAGELHAYLDGVGIEIMANSDNVLRGGLTPKHVDVAELLKVLNFEERKLEILTPQKVGGSDALMGYPAEADEFALAVIHLNENSAGYTEKSRSDCQILLCTQGEAAICNRSTGQLLTLAKGDSVFVPAVVASYVIQGRGVIYRAAIS
jgi:mannose-6-phosphate isomerase